MGMTQVLFCLLLMISSSFALARSQALPSGSNSGGNPILANAPTTEPAATGLSFGGGGSLQAQLAASADARIGHNLKDAACYRAVKTLIAHALGKNLGCVKGIIYGGAAKDAAVVLPRAGFVDDRSQCKTPGVIRVYSGAHIAGYRRTEGDWAGHIEVMGNDSNFHSFYSSPEPLDETMGSNRRRLIGCFVPNDSRVSQGPLSRCGSSYGGQSAPARATKSLRRTR